MGQRRISSVIRVNSPHPVGGFCDPVCVALERTWGDLEIQSPLVTTQRYPQNPVYDERALAEDLNALSVKDRQRMDEEIHGVADVNPELPDFVTEKLAAVRLEIQKLYPSQGLRRAYDRAVFLRPQIESDDTFLLMLLRAKRFDARDAACVLLQYFSSKLDLFGDKLLGQKITWNDLTPTEQERVKAGGYLHLKGVEPKGRVILFARVSYWDLSDPISLVRGMWYINSAIEDDDEQQRKGAIMMMDLTGPFRHTPVEIVKFFAMIQKHMETVLFRVDCVHLLYDNPALDSFFKSLFGVSRADLRVRNRCHFGSSLEIQYSLRTFGIDIEGYIGSQAESFSRASMRCYLEQRLPAEEAWRKREEPFTHQTSKIALCPNLNDILLGRNKFAVSWPGNLMYNKMIESQARRYVAANGQDRVEKTMIALQTIHVLQSDYGARFLNRKDDCWEAAEEAEIRPKVSQSLRRAARNH